jgi:hypothetical protein
VNVGGFEDYADPTADMIDVRVQEVRPAMLPAIAQPRAGNDAVKDLLPEVPESRSYDRLERAAVAIGTRMGSEFNAQGNNRAIYSWTAGGNRIEGATVWLIGALWQEYGHVVVDTFVSDQNGQRVTITGMVADRINGTVYRRPHIYTLAPAPGKFARDVAQSSRWEAMQLQSALSKAERTTVEHFLPAWYVDTAKRAAYAAMTSRLLKRLKPGCDPKHDQSWVTVSLTEALNDAEAHFKSLGVSRAMLEWLLDGDRPTWNLTDLGELRALAKALMQGDKTVAQVFEAFEPGDEPVDGGGLAEVAEDKPQKAKPKAAKKARKAPEQAQQATQQPAPEQEPAPAPATSQMRSDTPETAARAMLVKAGVQGRDIDKRIKEAESMVEGGVAESLVDAVDMLTSDMASDDGADEGMP